MKPDGGRSVNETKEKRSLATNAVFNTFYRMLDILFPLVSSGYVARMLTPEGVGRYAATANNVSYFVLLGSLGIQAYAIRETAKRRDDKKARDKLFSEMLVVNAVLTMAAIFIFIGCMLLTSLFSSEKMLYFVCGFAIFINFINVDWYFQGTEEFKLIAIRSFVVKLLGLIAVILFIHSPEDVYTYALISVLSGLAYHLFNIVYASRRVVVSFRDINIQPHIKSLVFLALCTVSTELYARMDITMLGIMDKNASVAYYSYAQKIVGLIIATAIAITAVFLPRLSYYYAGDKAKFNKLTKFGADLMIFISFPTCLGIVAVASPLITLWLGEGYGDAVNCLMVLAFMIPLKCIGDIICYQVMMCAGKESYLMYSYLITMAVNFVNNLILIPRFGAFGASIASLLSEIIVFVLVYGAARKYQHYKLDIKNFVVTLISSAIMFGIVIGFMFFIKNEAVRLFGGAAIGAGVFFLLNVLFGNGLLKNTVNRFLHKKNQPEL